MQSLLHQPHRQKLQEIINSTFTSPGVYFFKDKNGQVLYVGKSINVRERLNSHIRSTSEKTRTMVDQAVVIEAIPVLSELEALLLEAEYIKKYLPHYNSAAKDDKHPLYIKVTTGEEYPKIGVSRKEDEKKTRYFGPFPSSATVKQVLRQVRKVFPYCSQKRLGKKSCFYSHIGLCNPCPSFIANIENEDKKEFLKKQYKSNVRSILLLLSGKTKRLEKMLLGEMKAASLAQNYEKAAEIRDQLRRISYVTKPYKEVKAYMENPNLVSDIREEEANILASGLRRYYPDIKELKRIECYDVAHTGGSSTTCSMVTFVEGEPEKNFYRRFQIKRVKGVDDFASLKEAVSRRLNHLEDWGVPDLIVIDGGKGQVSTIHNLFKEKGVKLPLIGLAKRLEEIVIPLPNGSFESVILGRANPAVKLLQRLRDEAHRFARSYHFKLRMKELLSS